MNPGDHVWVADAALGVYEAVFVRAAKTHTRSLWVDRLRCWPSQPRTNMVMTERVFASQQDAERFAALEALERGP